ncbi:MAG: hypothetical protein GX552_18920 [Chloroflexi bacterium]|nr:hypothetical protein [Chloroflexota bacterium]
MVYAQQTAGCSDFDITLPGDTAPSFRVLLPEWLRAVGLDYHGLFHTIPGRWEPWGEGVQGQITVMDTVAVGVRLLAHARHVDVTLSVQNIGSRTLTDVWANVCTSVNHLPGSPGWCNWTFMPHLDPDRFLQGRYWYEQVTPRGLRALTDEGWVPMHPQPDQPNADSVPLYSFVPSAQANARACAVCPPEGGLFLFQAWASPCRYCAPCPGNACMHLEPFLAETLPPGDVATIRGAVGLYAGDLPSLASHLEEITCKRQRT